MPQKLLKAKPVYVNTDTADIRLGPSASRYLKNYRNNFNKNPSGTEGGNFGVGTPIQSTQQTVKVSLPVGINKKIGGREFAETNEYYYMNWNSKGFHSIIRINGATATADLIMVDPILNLSIDPRYQIDLTRIALRVVYTTDEFGNKTVFEKFLVFTDGNNWQFWINVEAAIATQGYNETLFPYFAVKAPFFDRKELIQYAQRPPLFPPDISEIPYSAADFGKTNHLLKNATTLAYRYIYTDGRPTALSVYSEPYYQIESACNINNQGLPRGINAKLYAGGPWVEKVQIFKKNCNGDFVLYDTIFKFDSCGNNDPSKIGQAYWLRTNPFINYNYDPSDNTIIYPYYGDKETIPFDNSALGDTQFQTELPIKSAALSDAGDAILMSNNLKFYNNFDCETLSNIKINVTPATPNPDTCQPGTVKISCYAYIGEQGHANQIIFHIGDETDRKFGGIVYDKFPAQQLIVNEGFVNKYNLNLFSKDGFIGYLAGTPYFAISQQYIVDSNFNKTFIGVVNSNDTEQMLLVTNTIKQGGFFIQRFDFVVPAGNYIFRIAGHGAAITDNYKQTSTYTYRSGRYQTIVEEWNNNNGIANNNKEFELHACNGNIDMWSAETDNILVIYTPPPVAFYKNKFPVSIPSQANNADALSRPGVLTARFVISLVSSDDSERFADGYFTESATGKIGWEGAVYQLEGTSGIRQGGGYTDHNGFFFAYGARNDANKKEVDFSFFANCTYIQNRIKTAINQNTNGGYFSININWTDYNGGNVGAQNQFIIPGTIKNCVSNTGISGVGITFSKGGTFISDGDGNFNVITHPNKTGSKTGNLYYNAGGQCIFTSCNCSCVAIDPFDFGIQPCYDNKTITYFPAFNKLFKLLLSNIKALKGGGRYGVAIVGFDAAERATFANLISYADIPTFLETGVFTPSQLSWQILAPLKLPAEIKSVSFFLTKNTNYESYLQWVGDKIEFIDTNGNMVADGAGAIRARVTIQSLLDFNLDNNFATTVAYQFVQGDIVRFYDDGAGNLFKPDPITGFMDYQVLGTNFNDSVEGQITTTVTTGTTTNSTATATTTTTPVTQSDGKSFIINFDARLLKLISNNISSCGFWIELIRPKATAEVELYGEISKKYIIQNGEIANNQTTGIINAFDTYYQNRNIIIQLCGGRTFLHPFESASITDYWGKDCIGFGRVTVQDVEVKQYWDETETSKSDETINNGRINGMGIFRGKTSRFEGQQRGGIVAVHVETKIILFICTNDVFVTDYNNKFVQTEGNSGYVTATLDQIIGDPSKKAGITHGCAEDDRGTIVFEKGLAFWLDRKNNTPVMFDYEQGPYKSVKPEEISDENKSWFINKTNFLINFNNTTAQRLNNLIETTASYDPKNNDYILTFRPRANMATDSQYFVNNEREVKIPLQETFVYSIDQKKWANFTGYTPEGYGVLRASITGPELISFVNGLPYFHNSENFANFNTFYGIETESVIEVSFSGIEEQLEDKAKVFQSLFLQLKGDAFFADKIITNNPRMFSYIPLAYWKKRFNIWFATILGDGNTYPDPAHPVPSQLIDGNKVNGFWCRIRFLKDPNTLGSYFEMEKIALRMCGSEKTDK